ncbi:MAG: zinc ribbon domain-containing protein [candidate division KSB1 bacterium]|nr:zinc ribbon domain-containing protein [candidate division KSB1 bacterium]MDZ7295731.1 zinc ribbon domain-containing protein [candidate division KSB1 bacterium]MDZ7338956.1 zinc ribbon domain-containing protein [candidate division KSB1 bacterium]MDZ7377831.1 zinc ribbon domain-containing protein [candidate division KSB1 bacterium]MDZ7384658.1 zinc ribbon domain-containing protein [candidate division KSB1 bacterium]
MPIYEYKCSSCGHVFDVLQKVGETGEHLRCPRCGAERPTRMLSSFAPSAQSASSGASSCAPRGGFS